MRGRAENRRITRFRYLCLCASAAGLVLCPAIFAADKDHLAMLRDAQAAFDRVEHAAAPVLADASACVQTQAAMVSVAACV